MAKFRNYKFQAKGIRNNMTLHRSKTGLGQNITNQVKNVLQARETKWNAQQKMLMKAKIQAKFEKLNTQKDYSRKLLENCKSWGGPCVSAEELETIIAKPDNQDRIVKAEFAYFRQTHQPDMIARPDLFKINKISSEEQLKNLMILLSDRDNLTGTVTDLPTNADVLQMITRDVTHKPRKDTTTLLPDINDLCIVVWAVNGRMQWFLGYIKVQYDGHYLVDHIERESDGNDYMWKYPLADDVHKVKTNQIVPVKVLGDRNMMRNTCRMRSCVKNAAEIEKKFQFP